MTEYKRQQGKSYMICSGETLYAYEEEMLSENNVKGLLSVQTVLCGEQKEYWYDIGGKHSLEAWAEFHKMGREFLEKFMTALQKNVNSLGEYLLSEEGISLEPQKIFIDFEEKEIYFTYCPFERNDFAESFKNFMEFYLKHMEHEAQEDIEKCYGVYEYCQANEIDLEEILKLLYQKNEEKRKEIQERTEEDFAYEYEENYRETEGKEAERKKHKKTVNGNKVNRANKRERKKSKKETENRKKLRFGKESLQEKWKRMEFLRKQKENEREHYVFEPQEQAEESLNPTVFLGSQTEQILGELRYEGNGAEENLIIKKDDYFIGNKKDEADGCILASTVSRIHARIKKEDDVYYIEDMNSTNGTYVNGELLNYKERAVLSKNDVVSFAGEKYRFI